MGSKKSKIQKECCECSSQSNSVEYKRTTCCECKECCKPVKKRQKKTKCCKNEMQTNIHIWHILPPPEPSPCYFPPEQNTCFGVTEANNAFFDSEDYFYPQHQEPFYDFNDFSPDYMQNFQPSLMC